MKVQKSTVEYGIIGLGRFGFNLALALAEAGKEVMVLDKDENKIRQIKQFVDEAFIISSMEKEILEETGIQNCKTVIIGLSKEIDVSILTTLNIINMGIPRVISRATSDVHGSVLEKLGAEVIYPEKDMAFRVANRLSSSKSLDFIRLNGNITITEFKLPIYLIGKTVEQSNLRKDFSLTIIAIENDNETITEIKPDYILKENDNIVLVGSDKNILKFERFIQKKEKKSI